MIYKRGKHWHMDAMVSGVRCREALKTTDRREAAALEKKRVAEIQQGKAASKSGKEFARKPFDESAKTYVQDREGRVAERTIQLETERLRPLAKFFGDKPLLRVKAEDITAYHKARQAKGVSGRTINIETGILRRMLKKAKRWNALAEDVERFPEHQREVGRALPVEQKKQLFQVAGSNPDWMVAHCAAVLAASMTCRSVELKHLRCQHLDLFKQVLSIRRSKKESGHRTLPLNSDAVAALARLWERARAFGATEPDHYVFPACENGHIDPTRHQKTWRTAWRSLTKAAGLKGFRFHDLRHQAVTELSEAGASDATIMAIAGHLPRRLMEHYSHVRMAAKRTALEKLESGLMGAPPVAVRAPGDAVPELAN
jgi:integrase